jgi:dimethylargininase
MIAVAAIRTALVRPPSATFASGITTSGLGPPDLAKALAQHAAYVEALENAGVRVVRLDPDPAHPDSTFVEDVAVIAGRSAVLTHPGAPSRRGEVAPVGEALAHLVHKTSTLGDSGTVDGGDVLDAGDRVIIGISERTSPEGAHRLTQILADEGIASITLDIRGISGLLHLKSGLSSLGGRRVLAVPSLVAPARSLGFEVVQVPPEESCAAHCVVVNGRVFLAAGFPRTEALLQELGYATLALDMSEFQKMDGGLSCLSLRLP